MSLTYGVIALARTTFDMDFAEEMKDRAFAALDAAGIDVVGPRSLACDERAAASALEAIEAAAAGDRAIDLLLILQITFTDATMTVRLTRESDVPVAIWGVPEPRNGGRLRLNAYCGINLAAHALGKADQDYRWLFAAPERDGIEADLRGLVEPSARRSVDLDAVETEACRDADRVVDRLNRSRVSVIGSHPAGFDTCEYDGDALRELTGVTVDRVTLDHVFSRARSAEDDRTATQRARGRGARGTRRRRPGTARPVVPPAVCTRGRRRGERR